MILIFNLKILKLAKLNKNKKVRNYDAI